MQNSRKILITCALPYANRGLHLGHLVEHLMADFWTRYHKMQKRECHFVCADDTHGTPVMIEARNQGLTPEQLIENVWNQHTSDFRDFGISYSHYSSTNSVENRELCETFYHALKSGGFISTKSVTQFYCETDKMFLPDRFVKGTCPRCGALDQYGDNCEVCGATYSTQEVRNPYCSLCRKPPVEKSSDHLMFRLEDFREFLLAWVPAHTGPEMGKKMMEWFNEPLRDWDISRDAPYFGFKIPGYDDKYFYVWVDAPMGYVSTSLQLAKKGAMNFDEFWRAGTENRTEVYHFIGKDIVYFHTLFWPALLKAAGFRTPTKVHVHGMLSINGEKMSKSKGTNISIRNYLNHLDPQHLRYYFASKLNSSVDDFDWAETDFINRVNSDLVGKITNLGSRGAQMLGKKYQGQMTQPDPEGLALIQKIQGKKTEIADFYEGLEYSRIINEVRALADETNRYFDEKAPWKTADTEPEKTKQVLTSTLNIFRLLAIYLKPVLPLYAEKVETLMNEAAYDWSSLDKILQNHQIKEYQHLAQRIEPEKVKAMMSEAAQGTVAASEPAAAQAAVAVKDSNIEIEQFNVVDLRVAKIISAESVPEADKLLKLVLDLGPLGQRQVFAGLKSAYTPEKLQGRLTVMVANLKPRKMKFGMSEGMVLAAGAGGSELFILSPDSGAKPGDKVK